MPTCYASVHTQGQKLDLTDVVSATIASFRSTVDNPALMKGIASRQALKDYLDLLASAHPVKECVIYVQAMTYVSSALKWSAGLSAPASSSVWFWRSHSNVCNQALQSHGSRTGADLELRRQRRCWHRPGQMPVSRPSQALLQMCMCAAGNTKSR